MKLQLKVAIAHISFILCIHYRLCDELVDGSNTLKWTCVCAAPPVGTNNYNPASNCSTSCHCTPGLSNMSSAQKHISNKVVVIILLLCVILTAIAFTISAVCYFSHRNSRMQSQISSDRDSSWNSATNLISHRTALFPEFHNSNPITGFIWRACVMFRRKKQTLFSCIIQFSYVELELATNKFSKDNLIGLGGSSNVYRGHLKDGKLVAVKKLKMVGSSDADSEFLTEIELISRLNHCHVVPLLGYCIECQGKQFERLLVFEYMPKGNLRECLDPPKGTHPLAWGTRVKIALGVARGLEYLHEAAAPRILHRDIKSSNILLDDKYTAKITDLGMAKHLVTDDFISCTSSPARMLGTFGYFAPEYAIVGKASLKSDVFSFGVVILEIITGRQPIHKSNNKGDESLVMWAAPRLCNSNLVVSELPDPLLKGNFPEEEMQMMAHLARECLHWDPDVRPSMSEVVQILSAVASDKVKRRNLSANFLMGPSSCSIKSSSDVQSYEDLHEVSIEKVELGQVIPEKPYARCSLPLSVDQNSCDYSKGHDEPVLSDGYMNGLMLLMSNARSSHAPEDEVVDLTEPRFESFMQESIQV